MPTRKKWNKFNHIQLLKRFSAHRNERPWMQTHGCELARGAVKDSLLEASKAQWRKWKIHFNQETRARAVQLH
jgi:hypothetical protein